jgi:hypothetical protein
LFSQDSLLEIYKKGVKKADLICYYDIPESGKKWLRICVDMTRDPATSDIIGITYTQDLTEIKLNELALELMIGSTYELMLRADYKTGKYVIFVYDGSVQQVTKRGNDVFCLPAFRRAPVSGLERRRPVSLAGIWKRLQESKEFRAYYEVTRDGKASRVKKLHFYLLDAAAGQFCLGCRDVTLRSLWG